MELTGISDPYDQDAWFASFHPDDIAHAIQGHKKAAKTGIYNEVIRIHHGQLNEWRWFNLISSDTGEARGTVKVFNGIVIDVTALKRTENKILGHQKQLQALNRRQFDIEERERRRVAEVLHDDVAQDLALALFKLNKINDDHSTHGAALTEAVELIEQAISYTRILTKELSPPALCQMGLVSGLKWLTEQTQTKYGFTSRLEINGDLSALKADLETVLFRIVAELLANIAKHAKAANAEVEIDSRDNWISLAVVDDGLGFAYSEEYLHESDGFGLFMVSERIKGIGGSMEIDSRPGKGTRLDLRIPSDI
jgi:two-component system sensor histidine kinase UhpB